MGSWAKDLPTSYIRFPENATVKDWITWMIAQNESSRRDPNVVMVDIEQSKDLDKFTQAEITAYVITVQFRKEELPDTTIHRILSTLEHATGQRIGSYSITYSRNTQSLYFIGRGHTARKDGLNAKW